MRGNRRWWFDALAGALGRVVWSLAGARHRCSFRPQGCAFSEGVQPRALWRIKVKRCVAPQENRLRPGRERWQGQQRYGNTPLQWGVLASPKAAKRRP